MVTRRVGEILARRIGLDPLSAGEAHLERAIRQRMRALAIAEAQIDHYAAIVDASDAELASLIDEVVVPESWFFRDDAPFELLGRIADRCRADPARLPIRVLSLPCACGEEPYSIAMTLLDRGLEPPHFRVDAVDISQRSLDAARAGLFWDYSFRSSDHRYRDRYFERVEDRYRLIASVRSLVRFRRGNVLDPKLLASEPAYDVVFCRNLLIYLDEASRREAIANLERLLAPTGTLFVGHAEPIGLLGRDFRPAGESRCFAFARSGALDTAPDVSRKLIRHDSSAPATSIKPAPAMPARVEAAAKAGSVPSAARAAHALSGASDRERKLETVHPNLEEVVRLADQGRHNEAATLCEAEIRTYGPTPAAYFLLGVIRQAAGQPDAAATCFEKAVYLDPKHEEALVSLALLAQRRGDGDAAANFRRRAERAARERQSR
jgi:chemotaxis protein methyltransferase WspC